MRKTFSRIWHSVERKLWKRKSKRLDRRKYVISDVPLAVSMLFGANVDRMTYYDLVIRKEQTFLRNVYKTEVLAELFLKISFYSTTYTIRQSILIESSTLKLKFFWGITALLRQFWGDFWECWKGSNKIFQ